MSIISLGRICFEREHAEQLGQLQACPVQPAAHRSDRDPQSLGNLFITHLLDILHTNNDAVIFGQLLDGLPQLGNILLDFDVFPRMRSWPGEFITDSAAFIFGDCFFPPASPTPLVADRQVRRNPVQPGEKLRIPFETPYGAPGVQEGIL